MATLFSPPKSTVSATPPAPTVDEAQLRIDAARQGKQRRARAATEVVKTETGVATAARELTGN